MIKDHEMFLDVTQILLNIIQILAILAAAGGFLYWFFRGTLHPCLKLLLHVDREPSKNGNDTLTVSLSMENPGRASLSLEHVSLSVATVTDSLSKNPEHEIVLTRDVIDSEKCDYVINIAPSDAMHFGHIFTVEPTNHYVVNAMVSASTPAFRFRQRRRGMQWKSSRAVPRLVTAGTEPD